MSGDDGTTHRGHCGKMGLSVEVKCTEIREEIFMWYLRVAKLAFDFAGGVSLFTSRGDPYRSLKDFPW